ncbi:MAG: glycoside hydrolase family 127 protein [Puniceicoccales bacterium]|jgi:DUF1680 family protein|nr:glycoside hydrolase family 127 protein [Puniceicoccales bacterium]
MKKLPVCFLFSTAVAVGALLASAAVFAAPAAPPDFRQHWVAAIPVEPSAAADYPVRPARLTDVVVTDGFWKERIETNRKVTLQADFAKVEETGRVANFARAGLLEKGAFRGTPFDDASFYKIIEGASYTLAQHYDPKLDAYLDALIAKIAAAQELDGYLYTARSLGLSRNSRVGKHRWENLRNGHELYCAGHLYEAAVAHFAATKKRTLMHVALRNADLVCRVFGPRSGQIISAPGHPEIEIALVKLFRATGDRKYLEQAKFFLDMRGRSDLRKATWGVARQDHAPFLKQKEAVGHAVCAGYFYAAAADIAALTGERAYRDTLDVLWANVVGKKMHLSGGIGALPHGEAFGSNYQLPNETAYLETCAAVANGFWNHRMFLLSGDAKYLDVFERIIYNGFLSGISLTGDEFFYPNPLASRGNYKRSKWFDCACCPVNVVRFIPQLGQYAYAVRKHDVFVNLFLTSDAKLDTPAGAVRLKQSTDYPWSGTVKIDVAPEKNDADFILKVRIPGWAREKPVPSDLYSYLPLDTHAVEHVTATLNGAKIDATAGPDGFLAISRKWRTGDTLTLDLPMPVRRVRAHSAVAADKGLLAVERGPLIYCAETADNAAPIYALALAPDAVFTAGVSKIHDHECLSLSAPATATEIGVNGRSTPRAATIKLIPYYAWCHRGANQMRVWLPATPAAAEPQRALRISSSFRDPKLGNYFEAISDGILGKTSADHSVKRITWWPHKGSPQSTAASTAVASGSAVGVGEEWLRYDFTSPQTVRRTAVQWFDDTGTGGCRVPAAWRVQALAEDGKTWRDLEADAYPIAKDKLNQATFKTPVKTRALRLVARLPAGYSSGVLEWKVE